MLNSEPRFALLMSRAITSEIIRIKVEEIQRLVAFVSLFFLSDSVIDLFSLTRISINKVESCSLFLHRETFLIGDNSGDSNSAFF